MQCQPRLTSQWWLQVNTDIRIYSQTRNSLQGQEAPGVGSLPVTAGGTLRSETWQIKMGVKEYQCPLGPVGGKLVLELSFVVKSFKG